MKTKSSYTLVGLFVIILSAVFIWGILWISAGGTPQKFDYYLTYMTESVSGLNVDAALKFRGVDVGKVKQIDIDPDNPERIRILLQVGENTPVSEDTVATLELQGLTGIANINLVGGRTDSKPLLIHEGEEYPVIRSRPSLFARLDATMSDLLASLMETSTNINSLLSGENGANISRSIENVAVITENLASQSNQLDTIIAHLDQTLANARNASVEFPGLLQQFSQSAQAITGMADEIRNVGENLAAASGSIEQTLESSGEDLVDFTGSTLPDIAAMVTELRVASENLRRASEMLAQNPSVLVYGAPTPKPGPGE